MLNYPMFNGFQYDETHRPARTLQTQDGMIKVQLKFQVSNEYIQKNGSYVTSGRTVPVLEFKTPDNRIAFYTAGRPTRKTLGVLEGTTRVCNEDFLKRAYSLAMAKA